jgi:hypothetical protein
MTPSLAPIPSAPRPWIVLQNVHEVETWIETYNRELQAVVWRNKLNAVTLVRSASHWNWVRDLPVHHAEGQILLDVSEEAAPPPRVSAAANVAAPAGSVWVLPPDTLTQLVLGLSGLIATSQFVLRHEFRLGKSHRVSLQGFPASPSASTPPGHRQRVTPLKVESMKERILVAIGALNMFIAVVAVPSARTASRR